MRRALFAIFLAYVPACGSSTPDDPTALTKPIAQNVSISEIAILQSLKVPVMKDGSFADRGELPLIALRDSVLRVYVTPGDGFTPHPLTARARIVTASPTGSFAQIFSATQTISGASDESDLTTTINIPIAGAALERGASVTVVINDTTGDSADSPTSSARWPQDGSLADLDITNGADRVRVMIVPVQYQGDGSGRLPDTSDAQIEAYREHFYQLYPAAEVDITVRDPWPYSGVIDGSGGGIDQVLMAFAKLRSSDQPDPDVYYYGAFAPTSDFGSFCGGGCVTGLSPIGAPYSVGIGFTGDATTETAVHEVGHAHGRQHAPCGGAGAPDPNYPYPGALIGVWGYDPFAQKMIDPTQYVDMMSYCSPTWISDYHYARLFTRVRSDNQYYDDWMRGPDARHASPRYSLAPVGKTGSVTVTTSATREPWITQGEPREVAWAGGSSTAYFFPYDHLPGGVLYVPDEVPSGARVAQLREGEAAVTIAR